MDRFYVCFLLMLAGAKSSQVIDNLVKANSQPAEDLPSWYPSTRCSAGVSHTTPPGMQYPKSDNEIPQDQEFDTSDSNERHNTESTKAAYLAPGKFTSPSLYVDDQ